MVSVFVLILSAWAIASGNVPLRDKYEKLMLDYPPQSIFSGRCAKPKINSNRKARRYRTTLENHTLKGPINTNFCGKYFLFNEPVTGGGLVFLLDCQSGKVSDFKEEYASNHPLINTQSCLLIEWAPEPGVSETDYVPSAYGPPRLYLFKDNRLKKLNDPILK